MRKNLYFKKNCCKITKKKKIIISRHKIRTIKLQRLFRDYGVLSGVQEEEDEEMGSRAWDYRSREKKKLKVIFSF